jgi:hypothetical protein
MGKNQKLLAFLKNVQDLFGRPFLDKSNKGAKFFWPPVSFLRHRLLALQKPAG